jgi:acetolactate synthase I/II/III large subunit
MKKTGAQLTVFALEQVGVTYTFGIPGVHNTEIYDELNKSKQIEPILVTHEGGGAFMADAMSRTSGSIGCMMIVPAAGMTHAMSGIGEAYLDGIPMLIISGGIRTDTGRAYQLHDIDQHKVLSGITKQSWKVENHRDIVPTIYRAYETAISGEPGPVFVEIPVNLQLFAGEIDELSEYSSILQTPKPSSDSIDEAVKLLEKSKEARTVCWMGSRGLWGFAIQTGRKAECSGCYYASGVE